MTQRHNQSLRPDDFPIGSPESRAAARAMLELRERNIPRLQIVLNVARPNREGQPDTAVGEWMPHLDGGVVRIIRCPPGADEGTIERLLATP